MVSSKESELRIEISPAEVDFFRKKAEEKIYSERWVGRHREVKIGNFVNCWVTEEAFKKVLIDKGIWFRHRGLYVSVIKLSITPTSFSSYDVFSL